MILLQMVRTSGVCSLVAELDLPHRLRNPLRLAFEQINSALTPAPAPPATQPRAALPRHSARTRTSHSAPSNDLPHAILAPREAGQARDRRCAQAQAAWAEPVPLRNRVFTGASKIFFLLDPDFFLIIPCCREAKERRKLLSSKGEGSPLSRWGCWGLVGQGRSNAMTSMFIKPRRTMRRRCQDDR